MSPAALAESPAGSVRFRVAATADSRAELEACHCAGEIASGLPRRTELLKTLRTSAGPLLIVDAGDFTPAAEDPQRDPRGELVVKAMEFMQFDAVGLGDHELLLGPGRLQALAGRLPLVASNLAGIGTFTPPIPAVRFVPAEGGTVAVVAFVDPMAYFEHSGAFADSLAGLIPLDPVERLTALAGELAKADAVVVLAHAAPQRIAEIAAELPYSAIFVAGHALEGAEDPIRLPRGWIVDPGPLAQQVHHAAWAVGEDGPVPESARLIPLSRSARVDRRVAALVDSFLVKHPKR